MLQGGSVSLLLMRTDRRVRGGDSCGINEQSLAWTPRKSLPAVARRMRGSQKNSGRVKGLRVATVGSGRCVRLTTKRSVKGVMIDIMIRERVEIQRILRAEWNRRGGLVKEHLPVTLTLAATERRME
jgi:hypothetical protein